MTYIDGFVAAVPTANKDEFLEHAKLMAAVMKEAGAIEIMENWGNDVPDGEVTSFPLAVKKQPDETVVFSWIKWPDKATRDAGMQKMMEDERLHPENNPMPFDGKRVIFGGFETLFEG